MLRRRIRSALYIDFENVPLPPEAIADWLAWLEDGVFDPAGRRRRFLQKRVYWNSHAERNRDIFKRHGFVPILIGKYSGLKNGADIRMAMDIVETTYARSEVDEFILLTGDSDFVPVIERLKHKSKRTAIVVTEHRPNIHTTYHRNADLLIPSRRLTEAAQYKRRRASLFARLFNRKAALDVKSGDVKSGRPVPSAPHAAASAQGTSRKARAAAPAERILADQPPVLEIAAGRLVKLLAQQPRNYVSQKRVLAELERVPTFKRSGLTAYFGTGSYKALMRELARLEPGITVVDQPGGGTGVVYLPPESAGVPPTADVSPREQNAIQTPADDVAPAEPTVKSNGQSPPSLRAALAAAPLETATQQPDATPASDLNGHHIDPPSRAETESEPTRGDDQAATRPHWIADHASPPSRG